MTCGNCRAEYFDAAAQEHLRRQLLAQASDPIRLAVAPRALTPLNGLQASAEQERMARTNADNEEPL